MTGFRSRRLITQHCSKGREGGKVWDPADPPALVSELQRLLLVLFHLLPQLPQGVLELRVLLEEAPLAAGRMLRGALRGASRAWAAPLLERR